MSAVSAERPTATAQPSLLIKRFTVEENPTSVRDVGRPLTRRQTSVNIRELILSSS